MALNYVIDVDDRLVTISGEYGTPHDWSVLLTAIGNDPRLTPGLMFLRDLREATTPVDAAAVVGIMDAVRRFWPLLKPSRAAILTADTFDVAALTAHALADSHGLPVRMFTSHDGAMEWLREGTLSGTVAPDPERADL